MNLIKNIYISIFEYHVCYNFTIYRMSKNKIIQVNAYKLLIDLNRFIDKEEKALERPII